MNELNKELPDFHVGDTVTGTVVKLEEKHVLVDIGYKTEGIIPISELSNLRVETPSEIVTEGDEISLMIKKKDDDEIILSKKAVDADKAWIELEQKFQDDEIFDIEIKDVVKGGLVTDVGVRGFIPASLVETHYVEDFSEYKGKTVAVKIIDLDRSTNRVILSHRAVVEEKAKKEKDTILQSIEKGQVLVGTVSRLTPFGAFINLGGIDGLVHISELAHEHVEKVADIVSEGEEVKVEVLSVDRDSERISLSRKNVIPGPWENISEQVKPGDVLDGEVKRLVSFGAFVEVKPGVEGLVHISQIANRHIGTPQEVLEEGQDIQVKVLDVNEEEERMSLSIRELEEEVEDFKQNEKNEDQSSFQFGEIIGDKLDKYKH